MLKILSYPNEILRMETAEVTDPTHPKIKKLISEMIETMRASEGLGLAAPQIGENLKLCVIEIENEVFVLINPKIKNFSEDEIIAEEGCLSFPGKFLPVKRARKIKVKAIDSNGKVQVINAKGLLARAIQHEIDHLDGILFVDKAIENPLQATQSQDYQAI